MSSGFRRWLWRLRRITPGELALVGEAQLALVACQIARWFRPKGKLLAVEFEREVADSDSDPPPDLRTAARLGWAVHRAARFGIFRPQCLVRSLALQRMLRRRGIRSSLLRIGVRMEERKLKAHAWVELQGHVLGDSPRYVREFTPATDLRLIEL